MDWKRFIYLNSLVAAAYFVTAWMLSPLAMMPINAAPVWLPAGIALAAVLIWGYRLLPAAFIGDFLVGWLLIPAQSSGWWLFVLLGAQAAMHAWLGRFLLQSFSVWPSALKTDAEIVRFFLLGGLAAALPPALLATGIQAFFALLPHADWWQTLLIWWLGSALGVVILTPIILIFLAQPRSDWQHRQFTVALPMLLLLAVLLTIVWQTKQHETQVDAQRFQVNVQQTHSLVKNELDFHHLLLQAMRSYFLHSEQVTFAEFSAYLSDFSQHRHDVSAALWIEKNTDDPAQPYWLRYIKPIKQTDTNLPPLAGMAMCQTTADKALCQQAWQAPASLQVSPIFDQLAANLPGKFMFLLGVRDGVGPLTGLVAHVFDYDDFFMPLAASGATRWVEFALSDSTGKTLFQTPGFAEPASTLPGTQLIEALDQDFRWYFQYQPSAEYLTNYASWSVFGIVISALVLFSLMGAWLMSQSGRVSQIRQAVADKTQALEQHVHLLRKSEEKYRRLIENIKDEYVLYSHDVNGVFTYVSPSVESILGYSHTELNDHYSNYLPDTELNRKVAEYTRQTLSGKTMAYEVEMLDKYGEIHVLAVKEMPAYNEYGEVIGVEGILHDITALKKSQLKLEKLSLAVKHSPNAVIVTDRDGYIEYVNPKFTAITGYRPEEAVGKWPDLINAGPDPQKLHKEMWQTIMAGQEWRGEVQNRKKNGELYWAQELIAPMLDSDGQVSHVVATQVDITEARRLNEETSYQASHDLLTGLINRREFDLRLRRVIDSSRLDHGEHALCFLDLDQFIVINDTCGHIAGDELQRQLSRQLSKRTRKNDILARLGGDEFGILMEHCDLEQAQLVADEIRKVVESFQFIWDSQMFSIGVSIGMTRIDSQTISVTEVLKQADSACFAAKRSGRNCVYLYQHDDAQLVEQAGEFRWVNEIKEALNQSRMALFVQPIISLQTQRKQRYEVLVRLYSTQGKLITPGAFLPTAERFNLSERVDRWVIDETVNWLNQHHQQLSHIEHLAVNLSGASLGNRHLLEHIVQVLHSAQFKPELLSFEITETAAIANLREATYFINSLTALGCQFALDDFGSGLSSFGYLKNLPVNAIKIDGMFVRDIIDDPFDAEMVKAINEIGHVMHLEAIAEFVENAAILDKLRDIGVDFVQGYHLGKPLPIATMLEVAVQ